jgi:hypothetical protein
MFSFATPFYIELRIRDEKIPGSGSGIKHPGSATLDGLTLFFLSQCIRPVMTDEASQLIAEAYADLRTVDLDENRAR